MKYYQTKIINRWWGEDTINVPYHHIEDVHPILGSVKWTPIEQEFDIVDNNTIAIRATIDDINNLSYIKQIDDNGMNVAYYHFANYGEPKNQDDGTIIWNATFIRDQWMCHILYRFRSLILENIWVKPLQGMKNRVMKVGTEDNPEYKIDFKQQRYLERVDTNKMYEPHPEHDPALENVINSTPIASDILIGYTEQMKAGKTTTEASQGITIVDTQSKLNDAFYFNKYTNRYRYILAKTDALGQPDDKGVLTDARKINIKDLNGVSTIVELNNNFFLLIPCPNDDVITNWNIKYASSKGILGTATIITYIDWEFSPTQIASMYNKRVIANLNTKTDDKRVICSSNTTQFFTTLVNGDCFVIDNRQVETGNIATKMITELNRICDEFSEGHLPTTKENEPSLYNSSYAYSEWTLGANNMPKITADMLVFSDIEANQSKLSLRIVPTDVVSYAWNLVNPNPKYKFSENNDGLYFGDEKKVVYFTDTYQDWLQTNSTTEQMGRANIADQYQQAINNAESEKRSTAMSFGNWMGTIVGAFTGSTWVKMGQMGEAESNAKQNAETQRRMQTRELDSQLANVKKTPNALNIPSYKASLFNRFTEFVGLLNFNLYKPLDEDLDEAWTIRHWFGYALNAKQRFSEFINRVHRNFIKLDPSFNTDFLITQSVKHLPATAQQYIQPEFNKDFMDKLQQGFMVQNVYINEEPYGLDDEENWEIHGASPLTAIILSMPDYDRNFLFAKQNWSTKMNVVRELVPSNGTYVGYHYNQSTTDLGLIYNRDGISGTFARDPNAPQEQYSVFDNTDIPAIKSNNLGMNLQAITTTGDFSDWTPQSGTTTSRTITAQFDVVVDISNLTCTTNTPQDWIKINQDSNTSITVSVDLTTQRPAGTYTLTYSFTSNETDAKRNVLTRTLNIIINASLILEIQDDAGNWQRDNINLPILADDSGQGTNWGCGSRHFKFRIALSTTYVDGVSLSFVESNDYRTIQITKDGSGNFDGRIIFDDKNAWNGTLQGNINGSPFENKIAINYVDGVDAGGKRFQVIDQTADFRIWDTGTSEFCKTSFPNDDATHSRTIGNAFCQGYVIGSSSHPRLQQPAFNQQKETDGNYLYFATPDTIPDNCRCGCIWFDLLVYRYVIRSKFNQYMAKY